jgi:APA family basic amino acid/polyamine antiporter
MFFKRLFATKSLEQLHKEMAEDEGRLRRVLGPVGLTSLGVGAIIGAGIFVMTGRVAAENAGPAVMLSYVVAAVGCAFAALCYAEFASLAPVAGSAYTYAYSTLGELIAWIIGWDLILEYAMSGATVASAWSEYFNEFLLNVAGPDWTVPEFLSYDPISRSGAWFNLPALAIMVIVTAVLVIGIRESAASNTVLVIVKLSVVLFVIAVGAGYVVRSNWTSIAPEERKLPQQMGLSDAVQDVAKRGGDEGFEERAKKLETQVVALYLVGRAEKISADRVAAGKDTAEVGKARVAKALKAYEADLPTTDADRKLVEEVLVIALDKAKAKDTENWGMMAKLGLNEQLSRIDDRTRTNFTPYGLSGIMLGAALVFFAFIGFDSISTHSEEAIRPNRDVPIGIIASLTVCTLLYIGVSAVITGMKPYPEIDTKAAIASAFRQQAEIEGGNRLLKWSAALIAIGGLAGMTSVLLITLLSQARIFLAMARDGFLPRSIFATVHEKFKTPHISTMVTGGIVAVVAALTPIQDLEKMVNIGTLFAFIVVCAAVLILRIRRPDAHRPFRCPALFVVAPVGIGVNLLMALFLPPMTWLRLVGWLAIGFVIYFGYGYWHSSLRPKIEGKTASP